jgi:conjugal transfer pilus assembly protein TraL
MQTDTYIPRRLDDSWKIGFWDIDVATPVLFGAFLGYVSDTKLSFAICMATGIAGSRWVSRLKADKHPAFALHWLYWHLPASPLTAMRATPPSHLRRLVG